MGYFVHTLGQWSHKYPAEQLKVIYSVLTTYKLFILLLHCHNTAFDLSAISLLGREKGTCKILSYIHWN